MVWFNLSSADQLDKCRYDIKFHQPWYYEEKHLINKCGDVDPLIKMSRMTSEWAELSKWVSCHVDIIGLG